MMISMDGHATCVGQGGAYWRKGLPTLVMLHGAGLDRTVWVYLARYFSRRGYNLVVPDLPGHGRSAGECLLSIEAAANWVNRLVDQLAAYEILSKSDLHYCGHSMGSLVMLHAASKRRKPPTSLVLLGSAYPMAVGKPLLNAARANQHAAIDMINLFGHSFASQLGNNPVAGISAYNTMEALLERAPEDVLYHDLNACNEYTAGEEAAAKLNGKTQSTIIAGDSDRMTQLKMCQSLQKQLDAQLFVLNNCGHMMMSEQPEETLQALKQVLPVP